jgi:hypothetical protein
MLFSPGLLKPDNTFCTTVVMVVVVDEAIIYATWSIYAASFNSDVIFCAVHGATGILVKLL